MEKQCKTEPFKILMQTSKNIQDQIKLEISKSDLNITEFSVLETLYHKGQQTIHQIGNSILISSGSMTYVIDKLEKKDLLKRTDCPNDRRAIFIVLTPKGEDLMDKIMPEYQEFINHMFDSLNTEEAGMLVKLLQKIKTIGLKIKRFIHTAKFGIHTTMNHSFSSHLFSGIISRFQDT